MMMGSVAESLAGLVVGDLGGQVTRRTPRDGTADQYEHHMPNRPLGSLLNSTTDLAGRVINTALKGLQYVLIFEALLLSAAILYGALYWVVMPLHLHDKPLHFNYSRGGTAGSATATVDFQAEHTQWDPVPLPGLERFQKKLLKAGQHYEVGLELLMPTSPVNRKVGVFMVHTVLMDDQDNALATSARPAMLPHTSGLLKILKMFFAWPLYLLGLKKEAETIFIPCMDFYKEDARRPLTKAKVTVTSGRVQLYRASIHITPQLKGLPWLMHDWFYSTFAAGVIFITSLEVILVGFLYFFFFLGEEDERPPRSDGAQNRAATRGPTRRYTAGNLSSTSNATAAAMGGAANNEGLRRRGMTSSSSERQELPPGVQAYQRGARYVIRNRGGDQTPTETSERSKDGGPKSSDQPGRVRTGEGSQSSAMASWAPLPGNLDRDGGREELERQSVKNNSATVRSEGIVGGGWPSIVQSEGDELQDSGIVGEKNADVAGGDGQ